MADTMNTNIDSAGPHPAAPRWIARNNPLLIGAAAGVLVCSLLGIAAITGVMPSALSQWASDYVTTTEQVTHSGRTAAVTATCANCGTVEAVRAVEVKGSSSGLGAATGGLAGAVVGSHVGRGNGSTVMTVLGAAGGALAGNEIEKNMKKQTTYRVTVRMDDGTYRTVSQGASAPIGQKVRIVDGSIVARS